MNKCNLILEKLRSADELPFSLLLMADETIAAIEKYIYDAAVYIVYEAGADVPLAVAVLYANTNREVELKNIAVLEAARNSGIGSWLLNRLKKIAAADRFERMVVGTPDAAFLQLRFYEKNGFKKYAVRKNYYLDNYPEPIIEQGIQLRDMQMLELQL